MKHRGKYPKNWKGRATLLKKRAGWKCIRCAHPHEPATGYCLTVHHFDGNKSNCRWWNLLALCQRCHLSIQGRVDPNVPYMYEHSEWLKPYVAGFYAWKYLKTSPSRKEIEKRPDFWLKLERLA